MLDLLKLFPELASNSKDPRTDIDNGASWSSSPQFCDVYRLATKVRYFGHHDRNK